LSVFPSDGASKLGDALNLINAVIESEVIMLNKAESAPAELVTVADSETLIVAALAEVAMFSAAEKVADEVKVGAVKSTNWFVNETAVALELFVALDQTLKSYVPVANPEIVAEGVEALGDVKRSVVAPLQVDVALNLY
jgi:hypothetical protein